MGHSGPAGQSVGSHLSQVHPTASQAGQPFPEGPLAHRLVQQDSHPASYRVCEAVERGCNCVRSVCTVRRSWEAFEMCGIVADSRSTRARHSEILFLLIESL